MDDSPGPDGRPPAEESVLEVPGARLVVRRWRAPHPSDEPPLVVVHGFGEHSGRYSALAAAVAARGRDVVAFDQRGHGRSTGERARLDGADLALADLDALLGLASCGPGRPALLGHSMGGAFAAAYAAEHPGRVATLVLSSPAVHLARIPAPLVAPVRLLARVSPGAPVGKVRASRLSRDAGAVAAFEADPLCWHGAVPASTALAMRDAGRRAFAAAGRVAVPVLVLHGTADRVVPVAASRRLVDALSATPRAELLELAGGAHEPLQDLGREAAIGAIVSFIEDRASGRVAGGDSGSGPARG